jgi:hypothetical protein
VTVTWDDSSRIGLWNHIGLVRDPVTGKVILYANGTKITDASDTSINGLSDRTGGVDSRVTFHTDDEPGWQFNHFVVFKEALSASDMERVRQTLPV